MKIVKIILTSLVAVFILPSTTFAEGSTVLSPEITDEMFISRINSVNGKELIEIYNSSRMETEISEMSVSVFNSTVSQNSLPTAVFKFDEGYIDAEGFTLIKQDGLESDIPSAELSKNTDKSYGINHNYIVGASASSTISGGRIDLSINNEVSSICWGSWANSILSSVYCDSVTVVNDTAVAVSDLCKSNERCFNNPELNFGGYHKNFISSIANIWRCRKFQLASNGLRFTIDQISLLHRRIWKIAC